MASYSKFQSDNAKYSNANNRSTHNPEFNSNVDMIGNENKGSFEKNLQKYIEFASWMNFYPDLFLDLITPSEGGIKLHIDQRIYLRGILRFFSLYGVFPRGWSKTYLEVLAMFIVAIRFPGIELALTAQTKENAAEILKDKCLEIIKHYPLLNNEIYDKKFSRNDAEINFTNGSRID